MDFKLHSIGSIRIKNGEFRLTLGEKYRKALGGLDGFGHIQVLWWFDGRDNPQARSTRVESRPYVNGPDTLGAFAMRSPCRPNPIAPTCVGVIRIDHKRGVVGLVYIDANDGSPVLDIKPYTPSLDRVGRPVVPAWCAHWPQSLEEAGCFDWEKEFHF